MNAQQKPIPLALAIGSLVLLVAAAAPVWAFFAVSVEFPPMVGDDHGATTTNTPIEISLVANDADADGRLDFSTITIGMPPQNGIVAINPQTGVCTYAPALDYIGDDKFSYQIRDDGNVPSNTGFVTVNVIAQPSK